MLSLVELQTGGLKSRQTWKASALDYELCFPKSAYDLDSHGDATSKAVAYGVSHDKAL
jgi:hypothetical protein